MTPKPPAKREEAIRAIEAAIVMLQQPTALNRRFVVAALEHAAEQVAAIEELKRKRRKPKAEA